MSKKIYITIIVVFVVITAIAVAQIKNSNEKSQEMTTEKIKIGVLAPLTGAFADYGDEIRKGVESVTSPNIEYIFEDSQCDNKATLNAFNRLTEVEHVQFIIGPACGSPQEVITPLLNEREALTIVPSAAGSDLYERSGGKFFQMQYSLERESSYNADYIYRQGYETVGLISYQNAFSETHAKSFKKHFPGTVVAFSLPNDTVDISNELTKFKNRNIEALYSPDMTFFFAGGLNKMVEYDLNVPVYSTYLVELPIARDFVEGVTYSFPGDLHQEKEGGVDVLSKEAASLLISSIDECQRDFGCVLDDLNNYIGFDNEGVSNRAIVTKQIKSGQVISLETNN